MNKKIFLTKAIGIATCISIALAPMSVLAAPVTGTNITQQTIPVEATIDTYYEIATPAGLTGDTLELTRAYDDFVKTPGDTNSTFYGHTSIGAKGSVDGSKKITCSLVCNDLTRSVTSPNAADNIAPVGMTAITSAQNTIVENIWGGHGDTTTNKLDFATSDWTPGSTGLTTDFFSSDISADTLTSRYYMLTSTLPKDGTYASNLVINFSLVDAWESATLDINIHIPSGQSPCVSKVRVVKPDGTYVDYNTADGTDTVENWFSRNWNFKEFNVTVYPDSRMIFYGNSASDKWYYSPDEMLMESMTNMGVNECANILLNSNITNYKNEDLCLSIIYPDFGTTANSNTIITSLGYISGTGTIYLGDIGSNPACGTGE